MFLPGNLVRQTQVQEFAVFCDHYTSLDTQFTVSFYYFSDFNIMNVTLFVLVTLLINSPLCSIIIYMYLV
jgi:hypothetical protein